MMPCEVSGQNLACKFCDHHMRFSFQVQTQQQQARWVTLLITAIAAADNVFRLLHISVATLFTQQLQKDLLALREGKPSEVSLAAKWAPTPARKTRFAP